MGEIKKVTHVLALVGVAIVTFVASPAGQAVVHQYPWLSGIVGAIGTLVLVYHKPTA
jgi:hypothetical protein